MSLYDKPIRFLLADMLNDLALTGDDTLTASDAIEWFHENYPLVKPGSVRAHLAKAATNDPVRLNYSPHRGSDDLLFKVGPAVYRRYDPSRDPAPIHAATETAATEAEAPDEGAVDSSDPVGSSEFALERDLQNYLADNLHLIESGMRMFDDEGMRGFEYPAGDGRRIDILAVDASGGFVVLELKVSKGYDRVVGQILRYINWVRAELADPGQPVRGIIVCRKVSNDLRLACATLPDVELFEYEMSVSVRKVERLHIDNAALYEKP
ncbi:endonuclease NucS domain-containing protein [Branchiibius cervicis]|uniref:Endonuclease NucS domain-containing protein n=1 Tax=Branchiibius cervicis TaxID=908252 RepID=A0ABW2AUX8_9MICO